MSGSDISTNHHPRSGVEGEQRRRPPASGDGTPVGRYETESHQRFNPGRHSRAGQPGELSQFRPGPRLPITEQLEYLAGSGGRQSRGTGLLVGLNFQHGFSKPRATYACLANY